VFLRALQGFMQCLMHQANAAFMSVAHCVSFLICEVHVQENSVTEHDRPQECACSPGRA